MATSSDSPITMKISEIILDNILEHNLHRVMYRNTNMPYFTYYMCLVVEIYDVAFYVAFSTEDDIPGASKMYLIFHRRDHTEKLVGKILYVKGEYILSPQGEDFYNSKYIIHDFLVYANDHQYLMWVLEQLFKLKKGIYFGIDYAK